MKKNKIFLTAFLLISVVFAVFATVLQTFITIYYFDVQSHIYSSESLSPILFNIFLVMCALFFFIFVFIYKKNGRKTFPAENSFVTASSSLCGLLMLGASAAFFFYMLKSGKPYAGSPEASIYIFRLIISLLGIPGSIYFFAVAFKRKPFSKPGVLLSFFPIVWTSVFLISIYYDHSIRLNSPIRILEQMALISIMMYFLLESRFHMGKPKPGLYFAISFNAILLGSVSALPKIILTYMGVYEYENITMCYAFIIGCVIYIISRVCSFIVKEKLPEIDTQDKDY